MAETSQIQGTDLELGEKTQVTIFDELGLSSLPTDQKQALLEQMTELAMQRALNAMDQELKAKLSQEEMDRIAGIADQEAQLAAISEHLPNYMEIIEREMELVRSELTGLVK